MYLKSGRPATLAPAKVQIGQYPLPWWQPEWILREGGVSRFNSCTGVALLQFPWYFGGTFYNSLWVAEHTTTELWVTWKKYFLLLVNVFLSAVSWSFNVKTCSLLRIWFAWHQWALQVVFFPASVHGYLVLWCPQLNISWWSTDCFDCAALESEFRQMLCGCFQRVRTDL